MGGEIYVESELKKGTLFTCLIPLQESLLDDDSGINFAEHLEDRRNFLASESFQSQSMPSNTPFASNILVVEDNFIAQNVAKSLLSSLGCSVDVASDGAGAITLCQKNHYDLIFMDIGLREGFDGMR